MTYQILALSGGGFLGLYTACVLAEIEQHSGRPIHSQFDLIAGTSIGGIIALGLAAGTPAATIRDAMINKGPEIFGDKPPPQTGVGRTLALRTNAFCAGYRPEPLREVIEMVVGKGRKIGDLRQRVVVPAVNLTKGAPQVFKTSHHETFVRDWRLDVADVALATSAAPTFFPLHRIGGELFADGGLYANAPDQVALHEAEHFLGWDPADVSMLSIGTTTAQFSFSNTVSADMGWMAWMEGQRLPSVMISSQQMIVQEILRHRLGERYLRIDQRQSPQQERFLALDVASPGSILDLRGLAEASAREHLAKPGLQAMLGREAPVPAFFNN
jgi:patatin-like phospholipase/acyl hydrolase